MSDTAIGIRAKAILACSHVWFAVDYNDATEKAARAWSPHRRTYRFENDI
jgi:hypothetical protein